MTGRRDIRTIAHRFAGDRRGTSAVEFSMVSLPFILVLLMILQMGIYYMTKSSLDAGVERTADDLVNQFNSATASTFSGATTIPPTVAQLKADIATRAGGMVQNNSALLVDMPAFATLSAATLQVGSGAPYVCASPTDTAVLELRAKATIPFYLLGFFPGMGSPTVQSAAIVRLQGKCG